MKIQEIQKGSGKTLVLVFDGWGVSPEVFATLRFPADADVWVLYDYRSLDMPESYSSFEEIHIVAWSLGVWVATFLRNRFSHVVSTTAICGTPFPIHDVWGIPVDIFVGTLRNMTSDGIRRFDRRMCGDRVTLEKYMMLPSVSVTEKAEELQFLYGEIMSEEFSVETVSGFWQRAIISDADRIFPSANQLAYWQGRAEVLETDAPHLPFYGSLFQTTLWGM